MFPWRLKIKIPQTLPRAMDPDEVDRLVAVKGSVRDRTMILLLLRTGMRIGELLNTRMPMECLEKLLGHSRLEVTQRYAVLRDKTKEQEYFKAMAVIERRERDEHYRCDRELQAILEKTQLLPPHAEELYENP